MTRKIEEVHRYSNGNAGFRRGGRREAGKQSELRAVVKKLAKPNSKDEVAKNGVVNGGEQERAGALVGKREKQPSQTAQTYGKPVAEYDVHKAKGQAAGRNHAPATSKKRLVPLEEEGAIQEFLGIYRKQRIQQHNQRPEKGLASDQRKKEFRSEDAYCQA